jgi:hypothetical protein
MGVNNNAKQPKTNNIQTNYTSKNQKTEPFRSADDAQSVRKADQQTERILENANTTTTTNPNPLLAKGLTNSRLPYRKPPLEQLSKVLNWIPEYHNRQRQQCTHKRENINLKCRPLGFWDDPPSQKFYSLNL